MTSATRVLALATLALAGCPTLPAQHDSGSLPLAFVANHGQWEPDVRFVARSGPMTACFGGSTVAVRFGGEVLHLDFAAAGPPILPTGERRRPGRHHFLIGADPGAFCTDVPEYDRVVYRGVRPGIDLVFRDHRRELEYDVLVAPGADLASLAFRCRGHRTLRLAADGSLVVGLAQGQVVQQPPRSWYELPDGGRLPVAVRFRPVDGDAYGFAVDGPRPDLPLVIDPGLAWSTFVHGSVPDSEVVEDVAIDRDGSVLILGGTAGLLPGAGGANAGAWDAYVARLRADGSGIIAAAYLGGAGFEIGYGIAVEASGSIVVVGRTESDDFPQPTHGMKNTVQANNTRQNSAGFVARLSAGLALQERRLFDSDDFDQALGVAVGDDGLGNALVGVVGTTEGANLALRDPVQTTLDGPADTFVAVLRQDFVRVYCTYFGGPGNESGEAIALRPGGGAVITGSTRGGTFLGATPVPYAGEGDAFLAEFLPGGTLDYGLFLGGGGIDGGLDLALKPTGEVVVVGFTRSPDFGPVATSPADLQATLAGEADAFVCLVGNRAVYRATFFGGVGHDTAVAVAVHDSGVVAITGLTASADLLVTRGCHDDSYAGGTGSVPPITGDACFVLLDEELDYLVYSSYLGGAGADQGLGIAWDREREGLVLVGRTLSSGFPTTAGAWLPGFGAGSEDGFAARFEPADFGDAPETYQTSYGVGGPFYRESYWQRLGDRADQEDDGQPSPHADGDSERPHVADEDGVAFGPNFVSIKLRVLRPGAEPYAIDCWFDTNSNGRFDHPAEHLHIPVTVSGPTGPDGEVVVRGLPFDPRRHFSRFRLTWGGGAVGPTGEITAADGISHGEVEDYGPECVRGTALPPLRLVGNPTQTPGGGITTQALGVQSIRQIHFVPDPRVPGQQICSATVTGLAPARGGAGGSDVLLGTYRHDLGQFVAAPAAWLQGFNTAGTEFGLMLNPAPAVAAGVAYGTATIAVYDGVGGQVLCATRPDTTQPFAAPRQVPALQGPADPTLAVFAGELWLLWVGTDGLGQPAILGAPFDPAACQVASNPHVLVGALDVPGGGRPHSPTPVGGPDGDTEALVFNASVGNDSDVYCLTSTCRGARVFLLEDNAGWSNNGGLIGGRLFQAHSSPGYHVYAQEIALLLGDDERHTRGALGRSLDLGLRLPIAQTGAPYLAVFAIAFDTPALPLAVAGFQGGLGLSPGAILGSQLVLPPPLAGEAAFAIPLPPALPGGLLFGQALVLHPGLPGGGAWTNDCMLRL